MNFLLDTHVWVWGILEPDRIPEHVRRQLDDPKSALWLSPISVWETLLLAEKGRVDLAARPTEWVAAALAKGPWHEAPITFEIARATRTLALDTEDPGDRFLAATAIVNGFTLVTADRALSTVPGVQVMSFSPPR
ncbi:MAG: type II toxin-antitoxin system VapC family toxin [Planctomycetota bacterium]